MYSYTVRQGGKIGGGGRWRHCQPLRTRYNRPSSRRRMSVVRGRPPGLAGGIRGASRAYCPSLRARPGPESPTSARPSPEGADRGPALRCPHGGPPRRAAPFLNRRHGLSASRSPGRRALLKRPLTLPCHLHSRRWCSKRRRQCGQQRSTRVSAATIPRRTAGRLGRGGGPGSVPATGLFSPEPQVLQEGEGEQAQERVVVQPAPAAALEVVEPQLVLELLVQLLAHPPALDQGDQGLERGVGRQVRELVFALAGGQAPAVQPRLVPGQVPAA